MITENDLITVTETFFKRYWNPLNGPQPEWSSEHWLFDGTIPNQDKRGCYALFEKQNIIYIGVGVGKSFGSYHGSGLGDRLKRYWKRNKDNNDRMYQPTEKWTQLTSIKTIGFTEDHYWLASALEIFLISNLSPIKNTQHK